MKKTKIIITTVLLGLFFVVGCDKDFEEINTDPNKAIDVPSGLLTADIVRVAQNINYSSFVGMDMGSCWGQHMAKVNYEEEARYKPRNSVIEGTVWQGLYEDVVSDAYSMEQLAISEGNAYTQAVALILQAYGYHFLTDVFGNVPFSEAMGSADANFAPAYDSQEAVYTGILAMLDNANTLLTSDNKELSIYDESVKMIIPSMGRYGTEALSAAFRHSGINSAPLSISSFDTLKMGRGNTTCKECLPLILTIGSMMEY